MIDNNETVPNLKMTNIQGSIQMMNVLEEQQNQIIMLHQRNMSDMEEITRHEEGIMQEIEKSENRLGDFDSYVAQLQEIVSSKIELMQMLMHKAASYNKHKQSIIQDDQTFDLHNYHDDG